MNKYYVSLVKDLLGCYLEFTAQSELAVRQYLEGEYLRKGTWTLPWCSVYDETEFNRVSLLGNRLLTIGSTCGPLYEGQYD